MNLKSILYILLLIGYQVQAQSTAHLRKGEKNESVKTDWLSQVNGMMVSQKAINLPYTAMHIDGNTISLYQTKFIINSDGFPKQIGTLIKDNTLNRDSIINLIVEPMHFHFFITPKKQEKFVAGNFEFIDQQANYISWKASNVSENINMDVQGVIEPNGSVTYQVKVTALNDVNFSNINFHIPMNKTVTTHLLGLGIKAPLRPDTVKYNWAEKYLANGVWIGDRNAGLYYNLVSENYKRPTSGAAVKNEIPLSWQNNGKGGIQVNIKGSSMLADNFTGIKSLKKGEVIYYNFNLLILPLIKENQFNK